MDATIMLAVIALVVNLVTITVGATWAVGKVNRSVDRVAGAIASLNTTVGRLEVSLNEAHRKTNAHDKQLAVLEDRANRGRCPFAVEAECQPPDHK